MTKLTRLNLERFAPSHAAFPVGPIATADGSLSYFTLSRLHQVDISLNVPYLEISEGSLLRFFAILREFGFKKKVVLANVFSIDLNQENWNHWSDIFFS